MTTLAEVLGWKFSHAEGIETINGELIAWPESLGTKPTNKQITVFTQEYEAWKAADMNNADIKQQLDALDLSAIRPLLEGDAEKLAEITAAKDVLRAKLVKL